MLVLRKRESLKRAVKHDLRKIRYKFNITQKAAKSTNIMSRNYIMVHIYYSINAHSEQ